MPAPHEVAPRRPAPTGRSADRRVRWRLAALYGVLFLVSGALLLTTTYLLVAHTSWLGEPPRPTPPAVDLPGQGPGGLEPPEPPEPPEPAAPELPSWMQAQLDAQHDDDMRRLLVGSVLALVAMGAVSMGAGWVMAGRALQPLHVALESQRRFVASASHELRTPLTFQRTLLEVALADPDADAGALRSTCEEALGVNEQQEQLIDALLVLARSRRGLDRREEVDLGAVAADVLRQRHDDIVGHGLDDRSRLQAAPVQGDPQLLERLVANLVDNAVKHNAPQGWIEVATGSRDGRALLRVANSGAVIPDGEVDALFEPFRRLGADRTRGEGSGLGLSIVAAIVDAHDGRLRARARAGGGLDVDIVLPYESGY